MGLGSGMHQNPPSEFERAARVGREIGPWRLVISILLISVPVVSALNRFRQWRDTVAPVESLREVTIRFVVGSIGFIFVFAVIYVALVRPAMHRITKDASSGEGNNGGDLGSDLEQ